jgi:hypothetical protein
MPVSDDCWTPKTAEEKDAVQAQLERIRMDPVISKSPRSFKFLKYVVEHTLQDSGSTLKERSLGIEVFGRDATYDNSEDPIVRTTASEVRKRLALYYADPGHESELRIIIPLGSYLPEFHLPIDQPARQLTPHLPASSFSLFALNSTPKRKRMLLALAAVAALVILVGAISWWRWKSRTAVNPSSALWPKQAALGRAGTPRTAVDQFWNPIMANPARVRFGLGGGGRWSPDGTFNASMSPKWISVTEADGFSQLTSLLNRNHKAFDVEAGNDASLGDFRIGPTVFVGSLASPWIQVEVKHFRFYFENVSGHMAWIKDRMSPSGRNWSVDTTSPAQSGTNNGIDDYAIVARIIHPESQGIVIASGIGDGGTLAACEFLTDPLLMNDLLKQAPADWNTKNIEVVIGVRLSGTRPSGMSH